MGISISGSNAISGLGGNDTDFDKVLSQLKKIESTQLNRLEAWKSDWNLRYEGFTKIIEQIQAASSMLSQLSDKNNFVTKMVQSTNDSILTAVANASAQDVQHTIRVSQVANNAIWANTGHVFESKTDIINTTGKDQYFSYTYAGKRHDFKVPANTTLDSFASMINNSSDNPGIKVSLIQTGKGYVFQVAGNDTGVENDLIIHDSNLVGMSSAGTTSKWITNSSLDTSESITNPTSFVFDLILQGGAKKSVTVKGTATRDDLVAALNTAAGGINASFDDAGNLTIEGVQSFNLRKTGEDEYVPAGIKLAVNGDARTTKLNMEGGIAEGLSDDDLVSIDIKMQDGKTRTITIQANATQEDMLKAVARASQSGSDLSLSFENGEWSVNLAGVEDISFSKVVPENDPPVPLTAGFKTTALEGKGSQKAFGASYTSDLTLTFNKDDLATRVDGAKEGESKSISYLLVMNDGTTKNIVIDGSKTNKELLTQIANELGITPGVDSEENETLKLAGVKEMRLVDGNVKSSGWTSSLESTMRIDASANLFEGGETLEIPPDLEYVFHTNDGYTGTLKMPSGSSMADVLSAIKNGNGAGWTWKDPDGNESSSAPADWSSNVTFTDADGNEVDPPIGNVHLNIRNITSMSGKGISGQIAESSNWNIQRSTNARYQVDNWPIEMESSSNRITDVIEGVVFSIQDVGEARMTVSTDITSVEQSIQNFLDAVNSVIITVNDLMKYDETKEVTSNDPNDIGNSNYSASGLTNQKGNLLTGNYGVQLFKSRFSTVLNTAPPGFQSRTSADNVLSGDVLASLANLGIKTDTDTTSDTYGLLVRAPSSGIAAMQDLDKENYNDMITNHLEAVVDFFCASGSGSSSSTDFRYGSHVEGITKAGNYEVTYSVDSTGHIEDVYIGGIKATRDESMPGNYYSVASGDARGLSILIDDLTVGDHPPAGADPMYVRIKQGLVQTTNSFLKDELVFNDVNIPANASEKEIADALYLKSKNGALMSLRDNYKTVMESIDVKIEREQRRLSTWESRQKAIFANLETLLAKYGEQQKQLEGQLAQLSGSK